MEDRLKEIMKQLSSNSIEEVTSGLGIKYIENTTLKEIASNMYLSVE
jgi:hypothetical protein